MSMNVQMMEFYHISIQTNFSDVHSKQLATAAFHRMAKVCKADYVEIFGFSQSVQPITA